MGLGFNIVDDKCSACAMITSNVSVPSVSARSLSLWRSMNAVCKEQVSMETLERAEFMTGWGVGVNFARID